MKRQAKLLVHRFNLFLTKPVAVLIILIFMFGYFAIAGISFQQSNRNLLKGINNTVTKQDQTLQAIQELAVDNKLTSKRLGDTIVCMLLVPVSKRTTDTQKDCRAEAVKNSPDSPSETSTAPETDPAPSPSPSPPSQTPPTPQPSPNCIVDVKLGVEIHLFCPNK